MAGELKATFDSGNSLYCLILNGSGQFWSTTGGAFEAFNVANYANYVVSLTEITSSGGIYKGNFPSAIPAGVYDVICRQAVGGAGNESATDSPVGVEPGFQWSGTAPFPLSALATATQVNQGFPARVAKGTMIQNVPLYFKSSTDHVTPLLSGVVSGQIIRDSGSWGPLQSGEFVNQGNGFYNLRALTSGDLNADTVKLLFTARDVSGAAADPVALGWVLNRISGGG